MCGLFSLVSLDSHRLISTQVLEDKIKHGLDVINHRGPDGQGTWISPQADIGLGHARLSIIDLSGGSQPISSTDECLYMIVNGEFYNYENIRRDLSHEGYQFKTKSDSEILIPLYKKYGTHALNHLRGEFSFILHDKLSKLTWIARDRFGIKPLYYSVHDGYVYIASEIKSLFAAGIKPKWSKDSYLTRSFYFGNNTLYEGVYQVPPAHFMLIHDGQIQLHKYWDVADLYQDPIMNDLNEHEYAEILSTKFADAVKQRLRSDVEVGVYLSGGIDSSAVLAMATQHSSKPLRAFTLCFEDHDAFNEIKYASMSAQHLQANFNTVSVREADLADNFSEAIWHNETPFFNGHGIAKYILSRHVNEHNIKVVLTGEGADEVFGGYPHYQRDLILYHEHTHDVMDEMRRCKERLLNHEAMLGIPEITKTPWVENILGFTPSWLKLQGQWIDALQGILKQEYSSKLKNNHPFQAFMRNNLLNFPNKNFDPMHVSMYLWMKSFLPNFVLTTLGDRMEMAHSVEGRLAFLDHLLVEFVARIPSRLKVNANMTKHILRESVKNMLPTEIYQRKKHYFRAPQASLNPNSKLYTLISDIVHSRVCEDLPFFNVSEVRRLISMIPNMTLAEQANFDGIAMEVASLALLQSHFSMTN